MGVILDSDSEAFQSLSVLKCSKLFHISTALPPSNSGPSLELVFLTKFLSGNMPQVLSFVPPSRAGRMVMLNQSKPHGTFPNFPLPNLFQGFRALQSTLLRDSFSRTISFPVFSYALPTPCELTPFFPFLFSFFELARIHTPPCLPMLGKPPPFFCPGTGKYHSQDLFPDLPSRGLPSLGPQASFSVL